MDPNMQCPGQGLVLPTISIDDIATHSRFLILSLPNNEMSRKSPFAGQKADKTFLDSQLIIYPHKSLNSCRGVISEMDLLCASEAEILEGFSHQGVPQNPLRCFKCQRFGHSQISCRDQLTCSRCASARHSFTDCTLEPKCVNCSQFHPSELKLCP
ncbi:uncharacterized protein TNCV_678481 [Trichonephila clavipes]|nr:uncharacterized protein TNCV_678481 [Trichonephila clavipes]